MTAILGAFTQWQFDLQVIAWCGLALMCNYVGRLVQDGLNPPPFDRFDA